MNTYLLIIVRRWETEQLRHISDLSFSTGVFPMELKLANIVPIYKSGDDMVFSNYRPDFVLPVFFKVIENLCLPDLIQLPKVWNLQQDLCCFPVLFYLLCLLWRSYYSL